MTGPLPRIGEPTYTVPARELFANRTPEIAEGGSLPPLLDLEPEAAIDPSDEVLVRVEHPRIRVLSNYWHAGWSTAIPATWLRRSTFERLVAVVESLPPTWGFAVFDAWRPIELQRELFDAARDYPGARSSHRRLPTQQTSDGSPRIVGCCACRLPTSAGCRL